MGEFDERMISVITDITPPGDINTNEEMNEPKKRGGSSEKKPRQVRVLEVNAWLLKLHIDALLKIFETEPQ